MRNRTASLLLPFLVWGMTMAFVQVVAGQTAPAEAGKRDLRALERRLRSEMRSVSAVEKRRADLLRSDIEKEMSALHEQVRVLSAGVNASKDAKPEPETPAVPNGNQSAGTGLGAAQLGLLLVSLAAIGMSGFQLVTARRTKGGLQRELEERNTAMMEAIVSADETLVELLSRGPKVSAPADAPGTQPQSHEFFLRVADEIVRIQNYAALMPTDTKGLRHLQAALKRLREELEGNGYEIIEMVGMPYDLGLHVKADFKHDPEMAPGSEVITKVKKPQVNFKEKMVQMAEVEVTHNV